MTTHEETTDQPGRRVRALRAALHWLDAPPLHYIVAVILATALASAYLAGCGLVRLHERDLARQLSGTFERIIGAAQGASATFAPLLDRSCAGIRDDLTREADSVPYIRSVALVRHGRAFCSSRLGAVEYEVLPLFPAPSPARFSEPAPETSLHLAPGSPYQPRRPVLLLFQRVRGEDGLLYAIDYTYLVDALMIAGTGGADHASVHVRHSGTLTETGTYLAAGAGPAAAPAGTTLMDERGTVSVTVHLSSRKVVGVIAMAELLFAALGVLVAALAAAAYLGMFSPERRLLRAAALGLDKGEFYLVYQPLVDVATRRWVGAEALIRWNHPKLGPLNPQAFVDVIENSPLVYDLTRFVLRTALRETAALNVPPGWHLAINVTPRSMCSPGFAASLAAQVATSDTRCAVTVEVTERELLANDETALTAFTALQRDGINLAVDDFGTENSNIDLLSRYDFDYLKIDRQYTARLGTDKAGLFGGICALARHLGATVIAEGVEDEAQHDALQALGVPIAQGYLYQRPVPADDLGRLYAAQARAACSTFLAAMDPIASETL